MKLYVLVGVAGSGKTTFANNHMATTDKKSKVFSSDDYRIKMFGSLKEGNKKDNSSIVFNKMNKDLMRTIRKNKKEIILYDATNLTRRRRRALYNNVKNWSKGQVEVRIVYFSLPLIELLETNDERLEREPEKHVPENVIFRMYKTLQTPRVGVDCDGFTLYGIPMFNMTKADLENSTVAEAMYKASKDTMGEELQRLLEPHDCAPYHLESIEEHIDMCVENVVNRNETDWRKGAPLVRIAQFHDLGKSITKQIVDKNSKRMATYRGHANVSANYLLNYFSFNTAGLDDDKMDVVEAVLRHMDAHNGLGEKNIKKNKLNDNVVKLCEEFAEIDSISRVRGDDINER